MIFSIIALFPLAAHSSGSTGVKCPMMKIQAERLPDLNVPRSGHSLLCVNGEPTVIGGHTTNFVPTPTIEYYKSGKWHEVQSAFTHDGGFAVELTSGSVLIGGGHERNLGIGQSYEVELYDPLTHTCEGFGSLDTKRAMASAIAFDDNRAIIVGNWYHDDAIEMYDGKGGFIPVKATSCRRSIPHILRTGKDDAIIFTGIDSKGQFTSHPVIDRLHGEAYREPFLEEWGLPRRYVNNTATSFIGDKSKGDFSYLLAIEDKTGQMAIAKVCNGEFSLLPTDAPIPMTCQWGKIMYDNNLYADQLSSRAYLVGATPRADSNQRDTSRVYVVAIDYATVPAHLTFGYTDVLTDFSIRDVIMTTDGDLMMVGGLPTSTNFKPTSAAWLLHVSPRTDAASITRLPLWGWALMLLALAASVICFLMLRRKKREPIRDIAAMLTEEETVTAPSLSGDEHQIDTEETVGHAELMRRICQLLEEKQLYLNPGLKIIDLANALGTNRQTVSNCINSQRDCTFPQFVNAYRVAHAQRLLSDQPELKIAEVWMASGFSSEASFFRIFKSVTGTTPTNWKLDDTQED